MCTGKLAYVICGQIMTRNNSSIISTFNDNVPIFSPVTEGTNRNRQKGVCKIRDRIVSSAVVESGDTWYLQVGGEGYLEMR